jgi:hypothetical protein
MELFYCLSSKSSMKKIDLGYCCSIYSKHLPSPDIAISHFPVTVVVFKVRESHTLAQAKQPASLSNQMTLMVT